MKKRKLNRKSLGELATRVPVVLETEMNMLIVGASGALGSYLNPYSGSGYNSMINQGDWAGGYVEGMGYVLESLTVIPTEGYFDSHYIGPTSDFVMSVKPLPTNAADYVAMRDDTAYQELGLNGISGSWGSLSRETDDALFQRCKEILRAYESGQNYFSGYAIDSDAIKSIRWMRSYFIVEQGISGIWQ